jgi:hypothetical protein
MITASDFRDGSLVALLVGYDWESSAHSAELTVRGKDATERKYRMSGLTSWGAFEDFGSQHISHCTFLDEASGVYLCLDPFSEGERSARDNFWLAGACMARCAN